MVVLAVRLRRTCRVAANAVFLGISVLATGAVATDTTAAVDAVVDQPRPFGHMVGDVLEQRILLQIAGRDFEPATLPRAGRLGVWLERRAATLESSADGRRWLIVPYQVINAPQALTTVSLPAWEIKPKSGAVILKIAEWRFSIAPLTPRYVSGDGGLAELLPDHAAPQVATEPIRRRLWMLSSSCALSLAVWLGWLWWCNRRAAANQPFARALRELRNTVDGSPQSWQILHRAFDETAGRVVRGATLRSLFEQAPHFESARAQIEQFYAQSAQKFFGDAPPENPLSPKVFCRALRRIEKSHER